MYNKTSMLIAIALLPLIAVFLFVDAIPQWPEYHDFADARTLFGFANAHNVFSNVGLVMVGVWGVVYLAQPRGRQASGDLWIIYFTYFFGLILTGIGSGYYHHEPGSETLIWDRLPMTIMFMGLFGSILGEFLGARVANRLLLPLLIIGIASVAYWAWTESVGAGDLRMYALVQFLPPVLVLFMLFAYPSPQNYVPYIIGILLLYAVAKLCEEFDLQIYQSLGWISGHALKHLVSAVASASILLMLYRRRSQRGSEATIA